MKYDHRSEKGSGNAYCRMWHLFREWQQHIDADVEAVWRWTDGRQARNLGWYLNMKNLGYHNRESDASRNEILCSRGDTWPLLLPLATLFFVHWRLWLTAFFSIPSPVTVILGNFKCPRWTTFPIHWSLSLFLNLRPVSISATHLLVNTLDSVITRNCFIFEILNSDFPF